MELTIEHLAPYLPYGLKLQYIVRDILEKTGVMTRISHDKDLTHPTKIAIDNCDSEHIWMFKPILRPMSDLILPNHILGMGYIDFNRSGDIGYTLKQYSYLLKNHFDVFNLIPEGLAIDINTLPKP